MSIKLTKKELKQIVLEELEEIRTDGRGFSPTKVAASRALAKKGISKKPESVRRRLMQLVADLDVDNPTPEEVKELADMVTNLMDAAMDAEDLGLDEQLVSIVYEEIENYLEESLKYGLIDEKKKKKRKKKGCKPAKGKKYARRVKGRCVSYGAKGYSIAPGPSKGNSYCARSYGDMKSHGKDCSGKDRSTPLCLSRKKWKCSGKYSRKGK